VFVDTLQKGCDSLNRVHSSWALHKVRGIQNHASEIKFKPIQNKPKSLKIQEVRRLILWGGGCQGASH
jgi:hypothetical protein